MNRDIRRGSLVAALVASAGLAPCASAQQTFSTYVGPDFGNWSVVGNWNNLIVPQGAGQVAIVPGPRVVNLNINATVDKYGVGGVLRVLNGHIFGVRTQTDGLGVTGIFGGGTTALESVGGGTYLRLMGSAGSYAIHGNSGNPSFIQMSNSSANIIDGQVAGIVFFNESTIFGSGQVGGDSLTIHNSGTISASFPGGSLTIDPGSGGVTNSGALRSQGGQLVLQGGVFTNTGSGQIFIDGGSGGYVTTNGATIVGGSLVNLSNPGENFRLQNSSVLQNTTIAGEARIPNGHILFVRDGFACTGGLLHLDSVGGGTYLRLVNNAVLSGTNGIVLGNSTANIIDAQVSGYVLTNNAAGGIVGSGQLGADSLNVVNFTSVTASGSAGLTIDPVGTTPFHNYGRLIASPGSTLNLVGGIFDNHAEWHIEVQPNASCVISAATIMGGNLTSSQPASAFSVVNSSVLSGVTLTPGTMCNTPNGHLIYWVGAVTNAGTYNLNSAGGGTYLRVGASSVSVTGGGTITSSNSLANIIDAAVTGQVLTIGDQTLRGAFRLGNDALAIVNNGLIEAQGSQGIVIDSPGTLPFDNNATVRALTGSSVTIGGSVFDNAGGLVEAQPDASVVVSGSTIRNGTWRSLGTGALYMQSSSVLDAVTFDAGTTAITPNGHLNFWVSSVTNAGTYNLNSAGGGTYLRVAASAVSVTGGGTITSSNSLANIFDAAVAGQVLTINDETIRGACRLGNDSLVVVNNGLIEAQGSQGIVIDSPGTLPFDNNATVRALTGSSVTIGGSVFDNAGGLVEAQNGASVVVSGSTIRNGTWRSLGTGALYMQSSSVLDAVTFDAGTTAITPNGHLNFWVSTVTNAGTYNLNSAGGGTYLRVAAPAVTVSGGGTIVCSNSLANIFDAAVVGQVLTIGDQTLRGAFRLGNDALAIINNGSIIADASQGITIDPPGSGVGFSNGPDGLLRATGGTIMITDGPFSTAGTVIADAGRLIWRNAGTWTQTGGLVLANGEIQVDSNSYLLQGGTLGGLGLLDSNVTNSGGTLSPGASPGLLTIEGTYTQQAGGRLLVEVAGPEPVGVGFDRVVVTGTATLAGTISAYALGGYTPAIGTTFDVLTASSRTGTFAVVDAPEFVVTYTPTAVRLTYTGPRCDPDLTQDGNVDQDDVSYLIEVVAGGTNPSGIDPDINHDGNVDQDDISTFINVVAGGACP